jgi:hypothetical protein
MKESGDSVVERGDIVVTHDRARQMSLPRDAKGRPIKDPASAETSSPAPAGAQSSTTPTPPADADGLRGSTAAKRTIRTVGPQFIPVQ